EGVMNQRIAAAVRCRVIAAARQRDVMVAAAHEHRGLILSPERAADDVLIEPPRALEIADADGEVQDAGGRGAPRYRGANALGLLQRRALERAHQRASPSIRHCEEPRRGDEAIQNRCTRPWIASLRSQ